MDLSEKLQSEKYLRVLRDVRFNTTISLLHGKKHLKLLNHMLCEIMNAVFDHIWIPSVKHPKKISHLSLCESQYLWQTQTIFSQSWGGLLFVKGDDGNVCGGCIHTNPQIYTLLLRRHMKHVIVFDDISSWFFKSESTFRTECRKNPSVQMTSSCKFCLSIDMSSS